MDIDPKTLGAMMRLFRVRANRTKTELGKILGVDRREKDAFDQLPLSFLRVFQNFNG